MCFEYFVSCVHVRFYFSLPLIFTLLTKFSRMGSFPQFFTQGAPLRALRALELRYKIATSIVFSWASCQ